MGILLHEAQDVADELRGGSLVRVLRDAVHLRIGAFVDFLAKQWREAPWDAGQ